MLVRSDVPPPEFRRTTFFSFDQIMDGQRNRGCRHVRDYVDLFNVNPLTRNIYPNIGLVLMVSSDNFNLPALGGQSRVFNSHLCGEYGASATNISVKSRLISQRSDLRGFVLRNHRRGRTEHKRCAKHQCRNRLCHVISTMFYLISVILVDGATPRLRRIVENHLNSSAGSVAKQ